MTDMKVVSGQHSTVQLALLQARRDPHDGLSKEKAAAW
jgi:hypothetical protein